MGANWKWSFEKGRAQRLEAERIYAQVGTPIMKPSGIHSHDATMQSHFENGWNSPTLTDIYHHIKLNQRKGRDALDSIKKEIKCQSIS